MKSNPLSKTINNLFFNNIKEDIIKEIKRVSRQNAVEIKKLKAENTETLKTISKVKQAEENNINEQLMQFNIHPSQFNSVMRPNVKDKPEGYIPPNVLRNFSIDYPIARACIDYIKNKTSSLGWDIVVVDEEKDKIDEKIHDFIYKFFQKPSGFDSSMRAFQEQIIEDYLVMGSVAIEKLRTRGGKLINLLPVDSATIKVRVDDKGRIPNPPEVAFEQWIWGTKVAELSKNDLLFRVRNARSNTIFGLSPLESLIIQVQSALAGSLYNWKFFTDSNQAEGFVEMPDSWTEKQIKEFQDYFDALISGDPRYQRKLKFMPSGMKYTPTKKPEDMAFERFELWLLQQTCAVFGVPPQDIGFTFDVNRATAEEQSKKGNERVGKALISFLEELFTDVIQYELGFSNYRFKFIHVDEIDKKVEAELNDIQIKNGSLSVDEVRKRQGLEPIGLSHYILVGNTPYLVSDLLNNKPINVGDKKEDENKDISSGAKANNFDNEEHGQEMERKELKQWKKYCLNSIKKGKEFKSFKSEYIKPSIYEEINFLLEDVKTKGDVVKLFEPYINGEYQMIYKLKKILNELNHFEVN